MIEQIKVVEQERDALAATVEYLRGYMKGNETMAVALERTKDSATILAALKSQVRAQALRDAAKVCHGYHAGCEREILEMADEAEKDASKKSCGWAGCPHGEGCVHAVEALRKISAEQMTWGAAATIADDALAEWERSNDQRRR